MTKKNGVYYLPCKLNDIPMEFIFDTGASDVSISLAEAVFMLKNGFLKKEDLGEKVYYSIANGETARGTRITIKKIEIGGIIINNISASIVDNLDAPLLLGQSAIEKLGTFQIKDDFLIVIGNNIFDKSERNEGYSIGININNSDKDILYLCHYYGNSKTIFKDDSAYVTEGNSFVTFEKESRITGGIYTLLFKKQSQILEFILENGDEFSLQFSMDNIKSTLQFNQNEVNNDFNKYQIFRERKTSEYQDCQNKSSSSKSNQDCEELKNDIDIEMKNYKSQYIKDHPRTFLSVIFKSQNPTNNVKENEEDYLDHFWDDFPFYDDRLVYTPIYDAKLEMYFKTLNPSSKEYTEKVKFLLKNAVTTSESFKYRFWWLCRYAETNKFNQAFVYLIDNYVKNDLCKWLTLEQKQKYIDKSNFLRNQ